MWGMTSCVSTMAIPTILQMSALNVKHAAAFLYLQKTMTEIKQEMRYQKMEDNRVQAQISLYMTNKKLGEFNESRR